MGKVKCNYLFQLKAAAYLEHHPELDCLHWESLRCGGEARLFYSALMAAGDDLQNTSDKKSGVRHSDVRPSRDEDYELFG